MDYSKMSITELQLARLNMLDKYRNLKAELHKSKAALNGRQSEVKMQALAGRLSDKEKAQLSQVLSPSGVKTKEGVGTPGA